MALASLARSGNDRVAEAAPARITVLITGLAVVGHRTYASTQIGP